MNPDIVSYYDSFTPETLIRAMPPINIVIEHFKRRTTSCSSPSSSSSSSWKSLKQQEFFASQISRILYSSSTSSDNNNSSLFVDLPMKRFLKKLVLKFISTMEQSRKDNNDEKDDEPSDSLMELVAELMISSNTHCCGRRTFDENIPNPDESCHVSYYIPSSDEMIVSTMSQQQHHHNYHHHNPLLLLHIRVFPHHNDVGVRKVWEAGLALAEYLLSTDILNNSNDNENSYLIRDKNVLEIGAGVGFTGLALAMSMNNNLMSKSTSISTQEHHDHIPPKWIHMTDYTQATLENLEHNIQIYKESDFFLNLQNDHEKNNTSCVPTRVTSGFLEWGEFHKTNSTTTHSSTSTSTSFSQNNNNNNNNNISSTPNPSSFDVILAADVVYDRNELPNLVLAVKTFLLFDQKNNSKKQQQQRKQRNNKKKKAVFATTFRNRDTFTLFTDLLRNEENEILVEDIPAEDICKMPKLFPSYFDQPRTDIRICILSSRNDDE